ncbi:T9SS type B sorting domain-containing protein [bacterium]|nr:T9SS type B sorting domain-containing protein [bacterium]
MRRILLLLLFALLLVPAAKADHFIGSDFTWECYGGDTFKIILTFYQDCNGCHFGVRPTGCTSELCGLPALSLRSTCGSKTAYFTQKTITDITPVCRSQCTRCTKCDCAFAFGIRKHVLETFVVLTDWRKKGCCEVTISYYGCCRSTSITTGAANNGFYVDAQLNACQDPCDNSPKFTNAPVAILCVGRDFIYNQGATDQDIDPKTGGLADSLVYSFGNPMSSASTKTPWSGSYDYDKPLYFLGFPKTNQRFPKGFSLDTFTGDLMFRPMKVEITVMAIKVEQYRNGKKISETRRDIEIIIIKCPDNSPPVVSGMNCTQPKAQNFKTEACAGEKLCFTICTSDKDKDDTVTISWNGGIPGGTFQVLNKGDKRETGRFCWTPSESQVSKFPYSFVVTAKDNACPVNGFSARAFSIVVKDAPKGVYDTLLYDCGHARFNARSVGKIKVAQYMWGLNGNLNVKKGGDVDTIYTKFKYPGEKPFTLTLIGKNGCNKTYEDTVHVPKYVNATLEPDTTVCAGATLDFYAKIADSAGTVSVKWSTGVENIRKTSIKVGTEDTFIVCFVDDGVCTNADTTFIKVNTPTIVDLGPDVRICPGKRHVFRPQPQFAPGETDTVLTYNWFQGDRSSFIVSADSFIAQDSALYYVVANDSLKCSTYDSVMLYVNPKRDWQPEDVVLCYGDTAKFKARDVKKVSSFEWYKSPADTNGTAVATGPDYTVYTTTSQWYGVKWSEKIKGLSCYQYDSVNVKVNPLPAVKINPIPPICENYGALDLTFYGDPLGGLWFDTSDTRDYVLQGVFYSEIAKANGDKPALHQIGYTVTDFVTNCENTAYTIVKVNPLPKVELYKDTILICNTETDRELGQYVKLVAGKGSWEGPGVVQEAGKYKFKMAVVGTKPNEYDLTYKYSDGNNCTNEANLKVIVIEVPKVTAGKYDSVCVDATPFALQKENPKGATGQWYYNGLNNNTWKASDGTVVPTDLGAGKHFFSYIYTVPGSVCADTGSTTVTINPLPVPTITTAWEKVSGENRICFSSKAKQMSGNTKDAYSSFTDMVFSGNGISKTGTNYMFNPQTAGLGQHTIKYEVTNIFGCKEDVSETVRVDEEKKVSFTNDVVCLGDTVQLTAEVKNSDFLVWTSNGQGQFLEKEGTGAKYLPLGADLDNPFTIKVRTANDQNICPEDSFSSQLKVNPLPRISFSQSAEAGCAPLQVTFVDSTTISSGSLKSVNWTFGNDRTASSTGLVSTVQTVYGVIGSTDAYSGHVVAFSDEGCKDSVNFAVVTLLTPLAGYTPKPGTTTLIDPKIIFENKTEYVVTDSSFYTWNFDDYTIDSGGVSHDKDVVYTYSDTGQYHVKLIAENVHHYLGKQYNCKDSITQIIEVKPEILVYIPNIFTPDNSGPAKNNVFQPSVVGASEYHAQVFNRWGEKMWESDLTTESWDGTFNGAECAVGVYLYVVKVKNDVGRDFEFTGTVTLLR